ncbi:MAG: ATP-dependent helicase [Epsilonproteobacteria bacterium]|nr:ATP-dependent DNA helicase [Campylobacterota bacterium]NPA56535.1 ATP-dependent helicase [Campylobacterota bacterium]
MALNPEQQAAVDAPFGSNLVIASAGTGKTSTIVARIERLLTEGIDPREILLLTFTNKAAAEMVGRLERRFGKLAIEAGTFHAVSYRWLKEIDPTLTLKEPKELKLLFKTVYGRRDFKRAGFEGDPYQAGTLFDLYNLYQNSQPAISFGEWVGERSREQREFREVYDDIVQEFEELKGEYGYLSFNDLLLKAIDYRESIRPFREVLVDEYQDTNNLQARFLESLSTESLFCVGDYDQSIYAFNGANIAIIASFTQRYRNGRVLNLSKNYRSTRPILDLADRVISHNERIFPKRLEVMRREEGVPPKLLAFPDLYAQYEGIARMVASSPTPKDRIAIIFRNNSSADGIETALRERGIGCKRRGGISFFDLAEIKAFFDLLALTLNPKDMIAFIHIMEFAKGIGAHIGKELYEGAVLCGEGDLVKGLLDPLERNPFVKRERNVQLALFDDFVQMGSKGNFHGVVGDSFLSSPLLLHPKLSQEGALFLEELASLFRRLRPIRRTEKYVQILLESGIYRHIVEKLASKRAKLKDGSIDPRLREEALKRIEGRKGLIRELASHYGGIHSFYNAMVLGSSEMAQGEGVHLLTVHGSKGLEFDEVYIIDLMEGRFPNTKLARREGGSIEEERRLFYVAVTRARDILYLSYARYDPVRKEEFRPSRFLREAGLIS